MRWRRLKPMRWRICSSRWKPERLAQAVERARKLGGTAGEASANGNTFCRWPANRPKCCARSCAANATGWCSRRPEQICWFQVEDGVVKAHTATETFRVNYQLGELEAEPACGCVLSRAPRSAGESDADPGDSSLLQERLPAGDAGCRGDGDRGQRASGALPAAAHSRACRAVRSPPEIPRSCESFRARALFD